MKKRLNDLAQLKDGWFDGEGVAPLSQHFPWLEESWQRHAAHQPLPFIYPMLEGGLSLEWAASHGYLSLELDLPARQARVLLGDDEHTLDLGSSEGWAQLNALLEKAACMTT